MLQKTLKTFKYILLDQTLKNTGKSRIIDI